MNERYYKRDNRVKFRAKRFETQKGRCVICEREGKLVINHDHKTGLMRGLLCNKHNAGLGMFEDDINLLQKAIDYLAYNEYKPIAYYEDLRKRRINIDELCLTLMSNEKYTSDRARARELAKQLELSESACQSRISRMRRTINGNTK